MQTEKKNSINWGLIGIITFPSHILLYILLMSFTDVFTKADLEFFLNYTVITIPILLIVITTMYKKYGQQDFRFKSSIFGTIGLLSVSISSSVIAKENVINDGHLDLTKIPAIMTVILPTLLIIIGTLFAVNNLILPFDEEVSKISKEIIEKKNYKKLIENESILNDSIFGSIAKFINNIVASTDNLLNEMYNVSEVIVSSAEELVSSSEQVKVATDDVSSSTHHMSEGANHQAQLIHLLSNEIQNANDTFLEISKQIHNNTSLIGNIALQTNILALNAGIEASRAGDYGRGFAVVAENVRKLSDETKMASESIENVVINIQEKLGEIFLNLLEKASEISSVSEETAASSEEISSITEEMNASMEEIANLAELLNNEAERSSSIFHNLQSS